MGSVGGWVFVVDDTMGGHTLSVSILRNYHNTFMSRLTFFLPRQGLLPAGGVTIPGYPMCNRLYVKGDKSLKYNRRKFTTITTHATHEPS